MHCSARQIIWIAVIAAPHPRESPICANCNQITMSFVYLPCDSARNHISLALLYICTYFIFALQDCSYFAKLFFSRTGLSVQMCTLFARIGKTVKMGNMQSLLHVKVRNTVPYYRFYLQSLYNALFITLYRDMRQK